MSLQYITDDNGQTTGVFIPIEQWNNLKSKFLDIDQDIPDWHITEVKKRMADFRQNPKQALDFEEVMDEIEKDL